MDLFESYFGKVFRSNLQNKFHIMDDKDGFVIFVGGFQNKTVREHMQNMTWDLH